MPQSLATEDPGAKLELVVSCVDSLMSFLFKLQICLVSLKNEMSAYA